MLAGRRYNGVFLEAGKASLAQLLLDTDGDTVLDTIAPLQSIPASSNAVPASPAISALNSEPVRFGPISFRLPGTTGRNYRAEIEVQRWADWTLTGTQTQWQARLFGLGRREGALTFAGHTIRVAVQDTNSNGRFDDAFQLGQRPDGTTDAFGDTLFFDWNRNGTSDDEGEALPYGRFIFWFGQLCKISLAPGGEKLSLEPSDVPTGKLQFDNGTTDVALAYKGGLLEIAPRLIAGQNESVVPQGGYQLLRWTKRQDYGGQRWTLQAAPQQPPSVTVGAGNAFLPTISSLVPSLSADPQNGGVRFTLSFATARGDAVLNLLQNKTAPSLQLRLLALPDNPLARVRFKADDDGTFSCFWQPPRDTPPRVVLRLELDTGPFEVSVPDDLELLLPQTTK